LTDYPQIIKHPMDLGTVRTRLKKGHYKTLFQVAEDVRLVWSNCMTYNADGSDFYKLADSLQKKWDEKYAKLLQDCQQSSTASSSTTPKAAASKPTETPTISDATKVSLQERKNFAKSLYQISKEDLGKILVQVEQKCPAAIVRNATEDEVEFNIDKISSSFLQELTAFVNDTAKAKKRGTQAPSNSKKAKVSTGNSKAS
jgi:hypothetical protein